MTTKKIERHAVEDGKLKTESSLWLLVTKEEAEKLTDGSVGNLPGEEGLWRCVGAGNFLCECSPTMKLGNLLNEALRKGVELIAKEDYAAKKKELIDDPRAIAEADYIQKRKDEVAVRASAKLKLISGEKLNTEEAGLLVGV